jgi:signal transduction histidine kinase
MHLPDRCYPALHAKPRFVEVLLLPLRHDGAPFGTISIVSHRADRHFDRSDELFVAVLADVASAAWQLWKALESSRRHDEFLATIGHELRNPLAAMMTATSVLLDQLGEKIGPLRRAVDVLGRQGRHLARLIDALLDAGRFASGKMKIETRRLNLIQLVMDVLDSFRDVIEQRPLFLTVNFPDRLVSIDGDPVRLVQVFSNLIDNATKFTPPFGQISVGSSVTDGDVTICISDTGRGLRADQLDVIFEPFAQLSDAGEPRNRGLGLGLSLVRQIVGLHNGTVEAQSAGPDRGSRFAVRLPRSGHAGAVATPSG